MHSISIAPMRVSGYDLSPSRMRPTIVAPAPRMAIHGVSWHAHVELTCKLAVVAGGLLACGFAVYALIVGGA